MFKTSEDPKALQQNYLQLLQQLGKFLFTHNFIWNQPTSCFDRIYFNQDGTFDYFLFNFLGKPEDQPGEEKQKKFQRLLNLFIKDYKFSMTAQSKFAQCNPTTYMPRK